MKSKNNKKNQYENLKSEQKGQLNQKTYNASNFPINKLNNISIQNQDNFEVLDHNTNSQGLVKQIKGQLKQILDQQYQKHMKDRFVPFKVSQNRESSQKQIKIRKNKNRKKAQMINHAKLKRNIFEIISKAQRGEQFDEQLQDYVEQCSNSSEINQKESIELYRENRKEQRKLKTIESLKKRQSQKKQIKMRSYIRSSIKKLGYFANTNQNPQKQEIMNLKNQHDVFKKRQKVINSPKLIKYAQNHNSKKAHKNTNKHSKNVYLQQNHNDHKFIKKHTTIALPLLKPQINYTNKHTNYTLFSTQIHNNNQCPFYTGVLKKYNNKTQGSEFLTHQLQNIKMQPTFFQQWVSRNCLPKDKHQYLRKGTSNY